MGEQILKVKQVDTGMFSITFQALRYNCKNTSYVTLQR